MNELMEALNILEKDKNISKEILMDAIETSLLQACKNHFGRADNIRVEMDRVTGDFKVYAEKTVLADGENVEDSMLQISLPDAKKIAPNTEAGDIVRVPVNSTSFGRIATQNAKNVILQTIREEERKSLYYQYYSLEREVVSGVVQRYFGSNISFNLGKVDAIMTESEQVKTETYNTGDRMKLFVESVRDTTKGPRILVSRTHPDLVKRLFESEVTETHTGTVEIMAISREAGSRTKMAVRSNNPEVDAIGAFVGVNGERVNNVVKELRGEKIDIILWDENAALFIENAISPAKIICVAADEDDRTALVIVPDNQLSLAIGKEGQNARLAAKLTGYKIDIKSESQAREAGFFDDFEIEGEFEGYGDEDMNLEFQEDSEEGA